MCCGDERDAAGDGRTAAATSKVRRPRSAQHGGCCSHPTRSDSDERGIYEALPDRYPAAASAVTSSAWAAAVLPQVRQYHEYVAWQRASVTSTAENGAPAYSEEGSCINVAITLDCYLTSPNWASIVMMWRDGSRSRNGYDTAALALGCPSGMRGAYAGHYFNIVMLEESRSRSSWPPSDSGWAPASSRKLLR